MDSFGKWEVVEPLGEGGQGKVYLVIPKSIGSSFEFSMIHAMKEIGNPNSGDKHRAEQFELFKEGLRNLRAREDSSNHKALKVLHVAEDARDAELAEARIQQEIRTMVETEHPNLIEIVDYDPEFKWFVSQYYPKGSIAGQIDLFSGDLEKALKVFRPLVESVAELHKKRIVHRDIKPDNIFLDAQNNLILGDFGLVFFMDEDKTRISKTLENVGSRAWMPAWAQGVRIEDIKASFDVFSLGKVLWSLVSGKPKLLLWYFDRPQNNVEMLFPDANFINLVNPLLEKCVVEEESDCLPDATALLAEVDKLMSVIDQRADRIDLKVKRKCKVCGMGHYELRVNENPTGVSNFGITPVAGNKWKIFTCDHCGNVQLFSYPGKAPNAWQNG